MEAATSVDFALLADLHYGLTPDLLLRRPHEVSDG
ncbi:hypothetical protein SMA5143A_6492 [Streptomyces sp. MA5143a]|nr:hypothetical protein SMA5143A_6492 [Streptomyces sp. MA5143a]